ncbi:MAG TPA: VOC family protein [Candidatus Angelobacter sp.]|nr:VOC family protein [Candidatus Angelobacter sp.]
MASLLLCLTACNQNQNPSNAAPQSTAATSTPAKVAESKGVEFAVDPRKEIWGTMAIFKDPDGNQFVLSEK